jgi:hypothetical protein
VLLLSLLLAIAVGSGLAQTQSPPATPTSLAEYLHRDHPPHIFYVHGIGSDGPGDYDSWLLRHSICRVLRDCTTRAGTTIGKWDYADDSEFKVDAPRPTFTYFGEPVWKTREEWRAAAPYVVHFKLERKEKDGRTPPTIYVDELNWFPLTLSLKCRQIVQADAHLVGPPSKDIMRACSSLIKSDVPNRFVSYDWIPMDQAPGLRALPSHGAHLNRGLKNGLMDWGFSDAVLSQGPLRTYILDGIRQLISKSAPAGGGSANEEYAIVTHSLGSYLIFAALDSQDGAGNDDFNRVLTHTGLIYFFANQLRLLELANLDNSVGTKLAEHLERWGDLRCKYLRTQAGAPSQCTQPRIVALNDASDLLTWTVPDNFRNVTVKNYTVKNATRWLWLIESPTGAHDNYAKKTAAIKNLLEIKTP